MFAVWGFVSDPTGKLTFIQCSPGFLQLVGRVLTFFPKPSPQSSALCGAWQLRLLLSLAMPLAKGNFVFLAQVVNARELNDMLCRLQHFQTCG